MNAEDRRPRMKAVVWGVFLIGFGSAIMLDRLGVVSLPSLGKIWPVILFVIATTRFMAGRVGSGVTNVLLGLWLLGCTTHWNGFTFETTWPMALVAVGAGLVIRALSGEDTRRKLGEEE